MPTIKQINQYEISLASHPKFNEWQANVLLRTNYKIVVDVRFVTDPDTFVNRGYVSPNGVSLIYVGIERLASFVDVLRNEKPLSVALFPQTGTTPALMQLMTSIEPAGEAEGG